MSKEIVEVEREIMKKTKDMSAEMTGMQAGAKAKHKEVNYIG